ARVLLFGGAAGAGLGLLVFAFGLAGALGFALLRVALGFLVGPGLVSGLGGGFFGRARPAAVAAARVSPGLVLFFVFVEVVAREVAPAGGRVGRLRTGQRGVVARPALGV